MESHSLRLQSTCMLLVLHMHEKTPSRRSRKGLQFQFYLGTLKQLKRLHLGNNGESIQDRVLGSMAQMESLHLRVTNMKSLPHDMIAMSNFRKLFLECPQLIQMEYTICELQHLSTVCLNHCDMLEQLPDLHKLVNLKELKIIACPNLENLPKEFGNKGVFPKLEVFSLIQLQKLQELPILQEGAMPSLDTFSLILCESLKMLPECYSNLKRIGKIRVYGCSMVLQEMEGSFIKTNKDLKMVTMSTANTEALLQQWNGLMKTRKYLHYSEFGPMSYFKIFQISSGICCFNFGW